MRKTLDPKLDVVFKMLFADARNKHLLLNFLTAVLQPETPFVDVEVLNPEVPKEAVATKGAVLDVLARMADGRRVNIEMQAASYKGLWQRALYYWARAYAAQLQQGDEYHELRSTESVFVLNFKALQTDRYFSTFQLLEVHDHSRLTSDLAVHVIELTKLPGGVPHQSDPAVLKWAKFLAATTDAEREQLAMNDPEMKQAKEALDQLSADPVAQRLARDRELAAWNYERTLRLEREASKTEGVREDVASLCEAFDIELTPERQAALDKATLAELRKLHRSIAVHRAWPVD